MELINFNLINMNIMKLWPYSKKNPSLVVSCSHFPYFIDISCVFKQQKYSMHKTNNMNKDTMFI
jgi:hypothetical protein